ncbi:MAG: cytochrome c oxidase accessory protein CcoG [Bacteroidia bacterium]|nr:cytochrome c oxidase accessory protein CcoG [Bacteroidia bacterium]
MKAAKTPEGFRDQLYNVDLSGRRVGFHPKRPNGRFYRYRTWVSIILLTILMVTPWITVNGEPFMLFNFPERKFIILGMHFWPQDFLLFGLGMVALIVSIVLFTVVFGRIWCGWACPQTIFLEMVYRKIEYWIEGDAAAQRRLDNAPWDGKKIFKKTLKQTIFVLIAILVANTMLAYIIGRDALIDHITSSPLEHPITFAAVMLNSAAFYFVFAWFREQACIMVCPYGRLQGVLLDKSSLVISYDHVRGEPRGKLKKNSLETENQGDCIDCKQCIAVCPTGIDIRNGTQLECVNCTACIDACDEIMEKVNKPKGLVRFATAKQIEEGTKWKFTPRAIAYTAVLFLILSVLTGFMATRSEIEMRLLRAPGRTYTVAEDGDISNLYTLMVVNKSTEEMELRFELGDDVPGQLKLIGGETLKLAAGETKNGAMLIEIPPDKMPGYSFNLRIDVFDGDKKVTSVKKKFTGPL